MRRNNPGSLGPDQARETAEECYGEVMAYCRRHAPAGHDPADLAQETFLRFVRAEGYRERGRPAYNPALAVPDLSKRYGEAALEAACGYALERAEHPRCRFIRSILASGAAGAGGDGPDDAPGGYIRGAGYYGGGDR